MLGDYAVVAGGYNYPYWDPARFDRSIDAMVDNLVDHGVRQVFWVTLREVKQQYVTAGAWKQVQPYFWYFPTVNEHLRAALDRHPQLSLVDWASIADRPGLTYDAIHLNSVRRPRVRQPAGRHGAHRRQAPPPLPRHRDPGGRRRWRAGRCEGRGAEPHRAQPTRRPGFFTAYPCDGPRPIVSNLNFVAGQIVAASAIVPIGANGKVCVFQYGDANLIVDVTGSFNADSGLVPVWPTRAIDTARDAAHVGPAPTVVHVGAVAGVPADRSAVVVNLTTIGGDDGGTLRPVPRARPAPRRCRRARSSPGRSRTCC